MFKISPLLILLLQLVSVAAFAQQKTVPNSPEKVYVFVEHMPQFPGGQDSLIHYLSRNIRYPAEAFKNNQSGVAFISFEVDTMGQITQAQVLKSAAPSLDAEAMRVVNTMPRWQPGKQNGRNVRVKYTLPIRFQFAQQGSEATAGNGKADPQFPGGKEAMVRYLAENLNYPSEALAKKIEGDVLVSFTVLETGEKVKFKVEKSPAEALNQEAMRLIAAMPAWEPAKINGKPTAMRHAVSVPFIIGEEPVAGNLPSDSASGASYDEKPPQFPGGQDAMTRFIYRNLTYPADASDKGIQGMAKVTFVITETGEITDVETVERVCPSIDMEARRLVRRMPRWEPGTQNGKPVKIRYTLPIRFTSGGMAPSQQPYKAPAYPNNQGPLPVLGRPNSHQF